MHRLPGHPEPLGNLVYRDAIQELQHGLVSLLDHVQIPKHCGSVAHQTEPKCQASSGTGQFAPFSGCDNFLYSFKGAPPARHVPGLSPDIPQKGASDREESVN